VARVRKFVMLHKELDADDEEMTRTRKIRRSFVEKRYSNLVKALYGESESVEVETDIKYRDGTGFHMKTKVHVREVPDQG
jgi:long-chain acyl-CoA synthetase